MRQENRREFIVGPNQVQGQWSLLGGRWTFASSNIYVLITEMNLFCANFSPDFHLYSIMIVLREVRFSLLQMICIQVNVYETDIRKK